ncbi:SsgA family sporulation/cell division regulator [Streptomyces sp. NA04227]|uniref:SsgA family sporulation/cell division regulator n=1 Tax=Streptomyces sp. NA04227 TaxID=2742136 RepID=UPI0015908E37|nr:SsgA family sporulation/cell division regulator [Streptomyces sp. NA04227]QKW10209.1 SsgA family sporulation/cell division regulator [Streptomyces sp. NA04227]
MSSVSHAVEVRLIAAAPRVPVIPATLHFDGWDPFAVRMAFPAHAALRGEDVCWTFGRELLAEGIERAAGEGDVRVRPYGPGRTVLEFHGAEGIAVVHIPTQQLRGFLDLTSALVPFGEEHLFADIERDLAQALDDVC